MSAVIHLSDAQRDQFVATGLIVVEGEACLLCPPAPGGICRHNGSRPPEQWSGVVTLMHDQTDLGSFTIPALLPVHDANDGTIDHAGLPHICVSGDVVLWSEPDRNEDVLEIDPPRPGQFIARPERVE